MLLHLLNAGVRALAASVVLGGVLIYATSGLDLSNRALFGVIAIGFFVFWVVFFFMFGPRVPKHDSRRQDRDLDETGSLSFGRHGRRDLDGEGGEAGGHGGEGGGGDGGSD